MVKVVKVLAERLAAKARAPVEAKAKMAKARTREKARTKVARVKANTIMVEKQVSKALATTVANTAIKRPTAGKEEARAKGVSRCNLVRCSSSNKMVSSSGSSHFSPYNHNNNSSNNSSSHRNAE